MKIMKSRITGLLIAVLLMTTILPMTTWAGEPTWQEALDGSSEYLSKNVALTYGSEGDWSTFALARNLDTDIADDTYDFVGYYYSVEKAFNDNQISSAGDCARTILALNAIGRGGTELTKNIGDKLYGLETTAGTEAYKADSFQTSANAIQALQNVQADSSGTVRNDILSYLLANENAAHYWDYTSDVNYGGDADTTAAIITAYHEEDPSGTATDPARAWLISKIDDAGTINTGWGGSACSTAMALIAFAEQDIADTTTKSGSDKTTVDGLMTFYDDDAKAFKGYYGNPDMMSTYQANYALVAYDRSQTAGETSLFDFSDVTAVYYISFEGNGASNTMKAQSIEAGDTENLNANTFINRGYRFAGWKDAEGNTYTNKQAVTAYGDVKLYAIWERITVNTASDEPPKVNLNAFYEDAMRVDSYNAVRGDWKLNDNGKWSFYVDGKQIKGNWVKAINPAAGNNRAGWYYFDANGEMLTGWQKKKGEDGIGRWYYFHPHPDPWFGACYIDTVTPDGYAVDKKGAWMDPGIVSQEEIAKVAEKSDESTAGTSGLSGDSSSESKNSEKKITVSVSVNGNIVSGSDEVTLNKNASAFDALKALSKKMGWSISGSSSYVKGIGGEMEKSAGPQSGWTYQINGTTPNKSAGSYRLKDGDSVDWIFVYESDY